jgi:broad-specificity NMP kinase
MGRVLVVMSGLPGTGKSAIADALRHELGAPVLSVDPIEADDRLAIDTMSTVDENLADALRFLRR